MISSHNIQLVESSGIWKHLDSRLSHMKIKVQCNSCAYVCHLYLGSIVGGFMCPCCAGYLNTNPQRHSYEDIISTELERFHTLFTHEHTFETCRHKRLLRFDFHITGTNKLIECDERHHFQSAISIRNNIKPNRVLQDSQLRDSIKTQWCIDNNYELLRIKYTDFDRIPEILKEFLNPKKAP